MNNKTREFLQKKDRQLLSWDKYYQHLPIPTEWNNVSYTNDDLPSFQYDKYIIWINSPIRKERVHNHWKLGYDLEKTYIDWIYAITLEEQYSMSNGEEEFLIQSKDFKEVLATINKLVETNKE